MSISGLAAAILDFLLPVTLCGIGDSSVDFGAEIHGCQRWNFDAILSRRRVINISGL